MRCAVKGQIFSNALDASGIKSLVEVNQSIITADEVSDMLTDYGSFVGRDDFNELAEEQERTKKAFEGIRRFKEFGLLMPPLESINNVITGITDTFFRTMVTTTKEAIAFVDTIPGTLYNTKGKLYSNFPIDILNSKIAKRLEFSELNTSTKYFTQHKDGSITPNKTLMNAINNHEYEVYLSRLSNIGDSFGNDVEESFKAGVKELKEGPVMSNLGHKRSGLYKRLRILRNTAGFDAAKAIELEADISILDTTIASIKKNMDSSKLLKIFDDTLTQVAADLVDKTSMTDETIAANVDAVNMIISAGKVGVGNHILSRQEQNTGLREDIHRRAFKAEDLKNELENLSLARLKDNAEESFDMDITLTEFQNVYGLGDWLAQLFSNALGIQHVANPAVQYLNKITEKSIFDANYIARTINNQIERLYKAAVHSDSDSDLLYQKNKDGSRVGRMTDVFSNNFWLGATQRKFKKNLKFRKENGINLDPSILFNTPLDSDANTTLRAEINANMGAYMGDKYIESARQKYEVFTQVKAHNKANMTTTEYTLWLKNNDPKARIIAINANASRTKTSDKFLLFIPKKTTSKGELTEFYDKSYQEIESRSDLFELYKYVREQFIINQRAMNKFSEDLKPPKLGFLNRSALEHLQNGDTARAVAAMKDKATMAYGKQNLQAKKYSINKATNEQQSKLEEELHSISDEISFRVREYAKNDQKYVDLAKKTTPSGMREFSEYKTELYDKFAADVDKDMSGDFLQSITMSNYSAQTFIHKSAIEAEIRLTLNLLKSKAIDVDVESKQSKFASAHKKLHDLVNNYVDRRFYGIQNLEQDPFVSLRDRFEKGKGLTKNKDGSEKTGMTIRPVLNTVIYATRLIALGWSSSTALYNFGQAFISNINKGIQGDYFKVSDFLSSYMDILQPKNQKIIEMLYIMGDVAHQYEKRTIHEEKWKKRLGSMYIQTKVEQINQGSVAIAIMKNTEVTNMETGEVLTLFEAMDETGILSDKFEGSISKNGKVYKGMEFMAEVVLTRIRPANAQASGDYINPLLAENNSGGKLLMIFKKFLPEMVLDRFGSSRVNYMEQRRMQGSVASLGEIVIAHIRGDKINELTTKRAIDAVKEIILVTSTKIMALLMGKLLCETVKCKELHPTILFLVNYLDKVTDDAMSVLSGGIYGVLSSPLSSMSILETSVKSILYTGSMVVPGVDPAVYKQDTEFHEKGDAKAPAHLLKLVPILGGNYYRPRMMWTKRRQGTFTGLSTPDTSETKTESSPFKGL